MRSTHPSAPNGPEEYNPLKTPAQYKEILNQGEVSLLRTYLDTIVKKMEGWKPGPAVSIDLSGMASLNPHTYLRVAKELRRLGDVRGWDITFLQHNRSIIEIREKNPQYDMSGLYETR